MPPVMGPNSDSAPNPPRLCHLVESADFKGFGFNLHTVKERAGQFIGVVDAGSPAERARLKKGDRIIEVNGVNIANENHTQVVARIRKVKNETKLLVVDVEADNWYKNNNIVVTGAMSDVVKFSSESKSPSRRSSKTPSVDDTKTNGTSEDRRSLASVGSGSSAVHSETSNSQHESANDDEDNKDNETSAAETSEEEDRRMSEISSAPEEQKDSTCAGEEETDDASDDESSEQEEEPESDDVVDAPETAAVGFVADSPRSSIDEDDKSSEKDNEANEIAERSNTDDSKSVSASEKSASIDTEPEKAEEPETDVVKKAVVERSDSGSSASSGGSAANSTTSTDRAAEEQSASPSPPSSMEGCPPSPTRYVPMSAPIPGLNINMSAAEMRAYLASKKKKDIRSTDMDMKKKYDMIQQL